MAHVMKSIRFFIVTVLCFNSVLMVSSERHFPVPSLYGVPSGVVSSGNISALTKMFSFPDHMLVVKIVIVGFLMFIVYAHKDQIAAKIKENVDPNSYIESYLPDYLGMPLKVAIMPLTKAMKFLYGCAKQYAYNNKIYIAGSVGAPLLGWVVGQSMIGGLCGGASFFGGLLKSIHQHLDRIENKVDILDRKFDVLREENNQHYENIQEKIGDVQQDAIEHKKEILDVVEQKTNNLSNQNENTQEKIGKLSDQIEGVTIQISQLQDNVGGQLNKVEGGIKSLSGKLEDLIGQVNTLPDQINIKNIEELNSIKQLLKQIDGTQVTQTDDLKNIQEKLDTLLNKNEVYEEKIVVLLDKIVVGQLLLEEMKDQSNNQENVFKDMQTIIKEIHQKTEKNQKNLTKSSNESLKKFSDLITRLATLEVTVKDNHIFVENKFQQVEKTIKSNHEVVCQMLAQKCDDLEKKLELQEEGNLKREKKKDELIAILFEKIDSMEKNQQGTNNILNHLTNKTEDIAQNAEELVDFIRKYDGNTNKLTNGSNKRIGKKNDKIFDGSVHQVDEFSFMRNIQKILWVQDEFK